jgi:hypothetical protein
MSSIPLLTSRSAQLFHNDDFISQQVEITSFLNEENDVLVKLKSKKKDEIFNRGKQIMVLNRQGTVLNLVYKEQEAKVISDIVATYKLTKIHRVTKKEQN